MPIADGDGLVIVPFLGAGGPAIVKGAGAPSDSGLDEKGSTP